MRITLTHGQFCVYQLDEDGRQSLMATFGSLAAAQEAFPQADAEDHVIMADPTVTGRSTKAKWLMGLMIAAVIVLVLLLGSCVALFVSLRGIQ
jgi:hypothetical protein